jgi:hypothetical protein
MLRRWIALLFAAPLAASPAGARTGASAVLGQLPTTMVWAWERREDLRWLPPHAGVAYIATTLELAADGVAERRRGWPLLVRPDTVLVPVVHVDASWRQAPRLNARQHQAVVERVLQFARHSPSRVVQLDFEVRRSQRGFLAAVVSDIRRQLPPTHALSVTALASWCAGDYWIGALAADEVVPMVFRMAGSEAAILRRLTAEGAFSRPRCGAALGIATDEPQGHFGAPRRYIFSPRSWTQDTWRNLDLPPSP